VLGWEEHLDKVRDSRPRALIPTSAVVRATVVMFLARLGSLNALEQSRPSRFWPKWVGRELPSADTIGRVCALVEPTEVRDLHQQMYTRLKRGKALEPPAHGLTAAILDARESHATRWFADHVYRHDSTAMLNFWLLAMACLNLFMAFYARNLKPAARRAASMLHISRLILAELYHAIPTALIRASP